MAIKINLLAVGKLKEKYWIDAISEYSKRISRFANFQVIEVDEKKSLAEEAVLIKAKIKGNVVVCDLDGKMITSPDLANYLEEVAVRGQSEFTFIIGSSNGLDESIKRLANAKFCFGKVTYPHQLMRVILSEQIYRALTINNNVVYHK